MSKVKNEKKPDFDASLGGSLDDYKTLTYVPPTPEEIEAMRAQRKQDQAEQANDLISSMLDAIQSNLPRAVQMIAELKGLTGKNSSTVDEYLEKEVILTPEEQAEQDEYQRYEVRRQIAKNAQSLLPVLISKYLPVGGNLETHLIAPGHVDNIIFWSFEIAELFQLKFNSYTDAALYKQTAATGDNQEHNQDAAVPGGSGADQQGIANPEN